MSGGIDSSVAAMLLVEQGHEVIGATLKIWGEGEYLDGEWHARSCCKIGLARYAAERLNIPYHVWDAHEEFQKWVVDEFCREYVNGRTPNPCIRCNERVKFSLLLEKAAALGADGIATGHYARIRKSEENLNQLWRGQDKAKEQSYFLHRLNQTHLSKTVFPLENLTKRESRVLARERDLPSGEEPESQEICFVPGNDYRAFVESRRALHLRKKGDILNSQGDKVGEHQGVYRYTIGQRHGLGIASPRPYYVKAIDPFKNDIIVGRKEELLNSENMSNLFDSKIKVINNNQNYVSFLE